MTNRRCAGVSALTIAVLLAAAVPSAEAATAGPSANGKSASVLAGESLTITLKPGDSGSSGFHWRVAGKPAKKVLRLTSHHATNGGAQEIFDYKALQPGATSLKLQYLGPARHAKPVKTFRLTVLINEPEPQLDCGATGRYADSSPVARSGTAVVFKLRRTAFLSEFGKPVKQSYDAYYGCALSVNRAFRLGGIVDLTQPHDFWNVELHGTAVGFVQGGRCQFDGNNGCNPARRTVESQDLRTGNVIRVVGVGHLFPSPDETDPVSGLVVSATGGLAWIEQSRDDMGQVDNEVLRSDAPAQTGNTVATDSTRLDGGKLVDPDSLEQDGNYAVWARDGARQSAPLR